MVLWCYGVMVSWSWSWSWSWCDDVKARAGAGVTWNDVELSDVVVLEDALGHLEAVGGGDLEVPQQQRGDEHLGGISDR